MAVKIKIFLPFLFAFFLSDIGDSQASLLRNVVVKKLTKTVVKNTLPFIPESSIGKAHLDHAAQHNLDNSKAKFYFNLISCQKCDQYKNPGEKTQKKCVYESDCKIDASFKKMLHVAVTTMKFEGENIEVVDMEQQKGQLIQLRFSPMDLTDFKKHDMGDIIELPENKSITIKESGTPIGFDENGKILHEMGVNFFLPDEAIIEFSQGNLEGGSNSEQKYQKLAEALKFSNAYPSSLNDK